jgi:hypothetical protein
LSVLVLLSLSSHPPHTPPWCPVHTEG